jgi:hypothetical protein
VVSHAPVVPRATSAGAHDITVHRQWNIRHRNTQKVGRNSTVDLTHRQTPTSGRLARGSRNGL